MPNPKKYRPPCLFCGTENARPAYKYCSNTCQQKYQQQEYIKRWLAGDEDGMRGSVAVSKHVRNYMKDTRGNKCERCNWAETNTFTNNIPVHLDHIDGNYKNNRPENLRFLCPNCHALTSNYGGANRGNGRPFVVYKR